MAQGEGGGRPKVTLSDEQAAQVEALASIMSLEMIADFLGISKVTFYAIMERQPEVSLRYKRGKANAIGSVARSLLSKAKSGDTTSMIFYLKTQAGWKETMSLEHTGKDGGAIKTVDLSKASDSTIAELMALRVNPSEN